MNAIGLMLNETKTRLCDARTEHFDFLGHTFGPERFRKDGHWYLAAKPSKKSVARVKEKLRLILRRGNVSPWEEVVGALNRLLVGWAGYFCYGTRLMAYRAVDNYVDRSVRNFLRRRHKLPGRGSRRFPDHVIFEELGVTRLRTLHVGRRA